MFHFICSFNILKWHIVLWLNKYLVYHKTGKLNNSILYKKFTVNRSFSCCQAIYILTVVWCLRIIDTSVHILSGIMMIVSKTPKLVFIMSTLLCRLSHTEIHFNLYHTWLLFILYVCICDIHIEDIQQVVNNWRQVGKLDLLKKNVAVCKWN